MDPLFDRIGNLFRSLFQDEEEGHRYRTGTSADPDMQDAWEELDEFLKSGKNTGPGAESARTGQRTRAQHSRPSARPTVPEELRGDYGNLECPPGASMDEVRKAYKRLIRQYHPDRFANDPKKLAYATEITQKLNQSYQRIKRWTETGRP